MALMDFFHNNRVPYASLVLFRFLFYGLFALDQFQHIRHSYKYTLHHFNVPHVPWAAQALAPLVKAAGGGAMGTLEAGPLVMIGLWIAQVCIALRASLNLSCILETGVALPLMNALTLFASQQDNFQHHYFVFLVLCIVSSVRWENLHRRVLPQKSKDAGQRSTMMQMHPTWQFALLRVQFAILYFWTAIAKLTDPVFLNGSVLKAAMGPRPRAAVEWLPRGDQWGYTALSWAVVAGELALCVAVLVIARLRAPVQYAAWASLVVMHTGMGLSGFQIGLFSVYMVVLGSVVCMPLQAYTSTQITRLLAAFCASPRLLDPDQSDLANESFDPRSRPSQTPFWRWLVVCGVLAGLNFWFAATVFSASRIFFVIATASFLACVAWRDRRESRHICVGHLLSSVAVVYLSVGTRTPLEAYQGQAHHSMRVGNLTQALATYETLINLWPADADARTEYAFLLEKRGKTEEAFQQYLLVVQYIKANDIRALTGLTFHYSRVGRKALACSHAGMALSEIDAQVGDHIYCNGEQCELLRRFSNGFAAPRITALRRDMGCPDASLASALPDDEL